MEKGPPVWTPVRAGPMLKWDGTGGSRARHGGGRAEYPPQHRRNQGRKTPADDLDAAAAVDLADAPDRAGPLAERDRETAVANFEAGGVRAPGAAEAQDALGGGKDPELRIGPFRQQIAGRRSDLHRLRAELGRGRQPGAG